MTYIKTKLLFLIIFLITINIYGCTNLDKSWEGKTVKLIESSLRDDGRYFDISEHYDGEANVFDTFYILESLKLLNELDEIKLKKNIRYVENEIDATNDPIELLYLYKSAKLLDIETEELKDKVIDKIDIGQLMDFDNTKNNSSYIDDIYTLSKFNILYERDIIVLKLKVNIDDLIEEIIQNNNKLYLLNSISNLINVNHIYKINISTVIAQSKERIDTIIQNKDYGKLYEIYELLDLVRKYNLDISELYNDKIVELEKYYYETHDLISHKNSMYLLKIINLINPNSLNNYKDFIVLKAANSEIYNGGYTNYSYIIFPDYFTYHTIAIKKYLKENIKTTTISKLYDNLIESIDDKNIDWKLMYYFIKLIDETEAKQNVIEKLNEFDIKSLTYNNSNEQKWFYYRVLSALNISVNKNVIYDVLDYTSEFIKFYNLEDNPMIYYCYSEIIQELEEVPDLLILEKIKKEIISSKGEINGFYKHGKETNLLTTYIVYKIDKNLKLNIVEINEEEFFEELKKYRSKDGGYSLIKEQEPTNHATLIGVLIEYEILERRKIKDFCVIPI